MKKIGKADQRTASDVNRMSDAVLTYDRSILHGTYKQHTRCKIK